MTTARSLFDACLYEANISISKRASKRDIFYDKRASIFFFEVSFTQHICFGIKLFNSLLSRFFYVRYASDLIKEGLSLLHKLTLILVTTFITWHFFMWQGKAWFYGSAFRESIKGKICMKANLTAVNGEGIIWKPKLIMISCNIILWLFLSHWFFAALRSR